MTAETIQEIKEIRRNLKDDEEKDLKAAMFTLLMREVSSPKRTLIKQINVYTKLIMCINYIFSEVDNSGK